MKRRLMVLLAILSLVGVSAVPALGQPPHWQTSFRTHLTGDAEVPSVETQTQGQAIFKFAKDGSSLSYKLIVANIEDAVAAHIHCGDVGENGPVGVTLFTGGPTSDSGILSQDSVEGPDEGNGCSWTTLDDVRDAIEEGGAYVNVHTTQNPGGEVRGQIR